MFIYMETDIHLGAGAFEQAMRAQKTIPGFSDRLSPGAAAGVLSAAMRSGLPASLIGAVIDEHFSGSAPLLKRVLAMYEGDDWAINLWHLLPTGRYKLCTELCRPGMAQWRYMPSRSASE